MHYNNTQEIWDELRELCPIYYGATYEKMADLAYIQWPCPTLDHPGTPYLYEGGNSLGPVAKRSSLPVNGSADRSAQR
ncbi:Formate dehydrogenase H [Serratia fonticola]|uniref:Formate dehydrogenase H n=1 Tax=Serratia fonticola TaxID=47917 RepID=A0A4U9T7P5_SERFO|nr:Formate dehydrogenase H [Serratia fonticola]